MEELFFFFHHQHHPLKIYAIGLPKNIHTQKMNKEEYHTIDNDVGKSASNSHTHTHCRDFKVQYKTVKVQQQLLEQQR